MAGGGEGDRVAREDEHGRGADGGEGGFQVLHRVLLRLRCGAGRDRAHGSGPGVRKELAARVVGLKVIWIGMLEDEVKFVGVKHSNVITSPVDFVSSPLPDTAGLAVAVSMNVTRP